MKGRTLNAFSNPMKGRTADLLTEIEELSGEIKNDGEVELSKELRETRLAVLKLEGKLDGKL